MKLYRSVSQLSKRRKFWFEGYKATGSHSQDHYKRHSYGGYLYPYIYLVFLDKGRNPGFKIDVAQGAFIRIILVTNWI